MSTLPRDHSERMERARLSLDGLSVGDAFGECFFTSPATVESLIEARAIPRAPWRTTDDTEMGLSVVDVLERFGTIDQDALAAGFAARYAADCMRGYGGTAHGILQAIGAQVPWRVASYAVFEGMGSMGNGGAMRVAPIGAYFADDLDAVVAHARASAEVTHAHPDGQAGAIAIAVAAALACKTRSGAELLALTLERTPEGPTREGIARAVTMFPHASVQLAVTALGNGTSVISADTVPFALFCAARHLDDYAEAMWTTVSGLGDRDTTCAIAGGIVALSAGRASIPTEWLEARESFSRR